MGKHWKGCKLGEIGHSELLFVEKDGKNWKLTKIGHFEPMQMTSVAKLVPLWWENIGKVANRVKLAILSHSELLFVKKDGESWKLTKIGHFEPMQMTSVAKLAIVGHFALLQLEMI